MLSLGAMKGASMDAWCGTARAIAEEIPLIGFYLQTAVGGIPLPMSSGAASLRSTTSSRSRSRRSTVTARSTWCEAWSRRGPRSASTLYTGNDDHIVLDLSRSR